MIASRSIFGRLVVATGCPTILYPLFFLISRLPRGKEIPSFFYSPFDVDFENILFFYYVVKFGLIY